MFNSLNHFPDHRRAAAPAYRQAFPQRDYIRVKRFDPDPQAQIKVLRQNLRL